MFKLSRELNKDLAIAGIPKFTEKGKIDFHSFRVIFVTYCFEVGANVKEAQTLARHATPDLTVNVYVRANDSRLFEIASKVQEKLFPMENLAPGLPEVQSEESPNNVILLKTATYG